MARRDLSYRFVLSNDEFAHAWIREYYRRPGFRVWRVVGGPIFFGVGVAMSLGRGDLLMRAMGWLTALLGVWYTIKPLLAMWAMRAHRIKSGRADVELQLTLHRDGIRIGDDKVDTEIPWEEVTQAGETRHYVWYELCGGSRGTIPIRVVDDLDALRSLLGERARWVT